MRFGTLLLILATPVGWAQTPDTIAAERYLPLPLGAVWEYEHWSDDCSMFPICQTQSLGQVQHRVVGDSVAGGISYVVVRTQHGLVELVRFDAASRHGVVRHPDGSESYWPTLAPPCPLDAPFGAWVMCEDGQEAFISQGEFTVWEGGQPITIVTKAIERFGSHTASYAADLGLIDEMRGDIGGTGSYLLFAHVGSLTYGSPVVAVENGPHSPTTTLRVRPNPVRDGERLSVGLPRGTALRVDAFDALGRRVHASDVAPGSGMRPITIDLRGWVPGVYVVRVTTSDGRTLAARVVRAD